MKHSAMKLIAITIMLLAFATYYYGCTTAETTTGKLAFQQKDYEKAEAELKKGLMTDKADAEGWYMLGVSQVELGKYVDARESFKTSLSLSPTYGDLIRNYWVDKYNSGINSFNAGVKNVKAKDSVNAVKNFSSALNYFNAAKNIIPDSVSTIQILGDTYTYLGKTDSALILYNSIIDKSKSDKDAIMIAKILYASGMKARETENWEKALDIFKRIKEIPYLPKDNTYYENAQFNIGFANYQIASKMATNNSGDFKPYLNEAVNNLEPLVTTSKDKELLKTTYEILFNSYDALGMKEKADDAKNKKQELENRK